MAGKGGNTVWVTSNDLAKTMRDKTDEELYRIVRLRSGDYTPEALKAATEEFNRRQLDSPIRRLGTTISKVVQEGKQAPEKGLGTDTTRGFVGFISLICLGLVLIVFNLFYELVTSKGYVPHHVETSISARQDWLVGENKDCVSAVILPSEDDPFKRGNGYVATSIDCDGGPHRDMDVRIFGRLQQPEHKVVLWRCKRESEGFTCLQTGAE